MKSKILSLGTVLILLLSIFGTALAAEPTVLTVNVGQITDGAVDISVNISGNTGLNEISFQLSYDSTKLSAASVTNGILTGGIQSKSAGSVGYQWKSENDKNDNGALFTASFNIINGDFIETALNLESAVLKNKAGTVITPQVTSSKVSLLPLDFIFENKTVVYNGSEQGIIAAGYPAGATVEYTNNAYENSGVYDVSATVAKAGYATVTKRAKLTIEAAPITVTANPDQKKRVDETDPELTYKYQGKIQTGDAFSGSLDREEGEKIGIYEITQGDLSLGNNYDITYISDNFEIIAKTPQTIEISGIPELVKYGSKFNITATTTKEEQNASFAFESSDEDVACVAANGEVTVVGTGAVEFTVKETGSEVYAEASASREVNVLKEILKIKANDIITTYGEAVNTTYVIENQIEADKNKAEIEILKSPVVISRFNKPSVGTHEIKLSGAEAENYVIDFEGAKLFVDKKDIQISALKVFDKIKDGSKSAVINTSSLKLDGIVDGDFVSIDLSKAKAEFASANSESDVEVTITGLELSGKNAGNYNLKNATFVTKANIKDTMSASENAEQIEGVPVETDATALVYPTVPDNYTISIKSSNNESVISKSGYIAPVANNTVVGLVFTVSNINDSDDIADTDEIEVTVPASTKIEVTATGELFGTATGSGEYLKNQEVTVNASANDGYSFSAWSNGQQLVSSKSSYTFTATEDVSLTAQFTAKKSSAAPVSQYVAPITASIPSGTVALGTAVSLKTLTGGATIYYTTDGTVPNMGSLIYNKEIVIDSNITIKAVAVKSQHADSSVLTLNYILKKGKTELKSNASTIKYMEAHNNLFRPDVAATRYEVLEALSQVFDIQKITLANSFSDIDSNYKTTVELFLGAGIIDGYPDGTFGGNRGITRAEFVKILSTLLNLSQTSGNVYFTDVDSHWAEGYIKLFADKGYIDGYPDGSFQPDSNVSRAEIVTIINRIAKTKKTTVAEKFSDLSNSHWAFDDIMNIVK